MARLLDYLAFSRLGLIPAIITLIGWPIFIVLALIHAFGAGGFSTGGIE